MEEKKTIKIGLVPMIIVIVLILAIVVIAYYMGTKNVNKQNEVNVVKNSIQEEFSVIEEEKESEPESEVETEFEDNEIYYITEAIKNLDNTYTLKYTIYDEYEITENEFKLGKVKLNGKEYKIQKNENGEYVLVSVKDNTESHYNVKQKNNSYYVESNTEFSTVYKLTNKNGEIKVSGDLKCEYGDLDVKETTVSEYFDKFEKREPVDTTNPSGAFIFIFENDECKKIVEIVTGH